MAIDNAKENLQKNDGKVSEFIDKSIAEGGVSPRYQLTEEEKFFASILLRYLHKLRFSRHIYEWTFQMGDNQESQSSRRRQAW